MCETESVILNLNEIALKIKSVLVLNHRFLLQYHMVILYAQYLFVSIFLTLFRNFYWTKCTTLT